MTKSYHHLVYKERCLISILRERGESTSSIANEIGVHRSTICRELQRNGGEEGYQLQEAHKLACERRKSASSRPSKMTPEIIALVDNLINEKWSPIQVSGTLKKKGHNAPGHETIYRYIWSNKRSGGDLYKHLRHKGKRYNKRGSSKAGRGRIPNRRDIDERPKIVEEKSRLGDWELDTIIGKSHKGVIVSMVDRASKLTKMVKVPAKTASDVQKALIAKLAPIKEHVLTLTSDNGKEFANHQQVSELLGADFFFAKPYHSWERGLNEHTNGLVRQYFPKSMSFDEITQERVDQVEASLNHRPRKVLDFSTPQEVFDRLAQKGSVLPAQ